MMKSMRLVQSSDSLIGAHMPTPDALCTLLKQAILHVSNRQSWKAGVYLQPGQDKLESYHRGECWQSVIRQAGVISLHSTLPSMSMQMSLI